MLTRENMPKYEILQNGTLHLISIKCLYLGCILQNENNLERKRITEWNWKSYIRENSSRREYQYKRNSTIWHCYTNKAFKKTTYITVVKCESTCICNNNLFLWSVAFIQMNTI